MCVLKRFVVAETPPALQVTDNLHFGSGKGDRPREDCYVRKGVAVVLEIHIDGVIVLFFFRREGRGVCALPSSQLQFTKPQIRSPKVRTNELTQYLTGTSNKTNR